jgi:hypothetical protein
LLLTINKHFTAMMNEKLKRLEVPTFETKLSRPSETPMDGERFFPFFFFFSGKSFDGENATRENREREKAERALDQLCEAVGSFPVASTRFAFSRSLFGLTEWT